MFFFDSSKWYTSTNTLGDEVTASAILGGGFWWRHTPSCGKSGFRLVIPTLLQREVVMLLTSKQLGPPAVFCAAVGATGVVRGAWPLYYWRCAAAK